MGGKDLDEASMEGIGTSGVDIVVTPGLVNAHHHLLQTAFRTLPGTRGIPMREWLPAVAAAYSDAGVDPELTSLAARAIGASSSRQAASVRRRLMKPGPATSTPATSSTTPRSPSSRR